jgi:hypothetical protein
MMKNILTVFAVLAMASVAHAGLSLSVDGVVSPPESEVTLDIGGTAVIDIHADQTTLGFIMLQGPGELDVSNPTDIWEQSSIGPLDPAIFDELKPILPDLGFPGVVAMFDVGVVDASEPFTTPDGLVINGLIFKCLDEGDVVLTLTDADLGVLDAVTIHQIPEPLTLGLLGLGGLFLRRRR